LGLCCIKGCARIGAAFVFNLYQTKDILMAEETIFSKIIRQEIPAKLLYQDDLVSAFRDISPQAPTHILIIPNKLIPTVNDVTTEDEIALGRLFTVARKLAAEEGIDESGYRLVVNCNRDGGQEVFHLHMHLLGGKKIGRLVQADTE
jgi:histidine triad (HIT) family protein